MLEARLRIKKERFILQRTFPFFAIWVASFFIEIAFANSINEVKVVYSSGVTQGASKGTSSLELLLRIPSSVLLAAPYALFIICIPFGYCIVPVFSFAFLKVSLAVLRALSLPSTSS